MNLLAKISVKNVCGKVDTIKAADGVRPLMRVYGEAQSFEPVATAYGDSLRFRGDFRAINLQTSEKFGAAQCFLPATIEGVIAAAISRGDANSVEFAFDIGVKWSEKVVGYEYVCNTLIESRDVDRFAALEQAFMAETPLLASVGESADVEPAKPEKTKAGK